MTEAAVRLAPGDAAPDFTLPDASGESFGLAGMRGQRVILYFYPAALTPGCTKEAEDFSASGEALAAAGVRVIGVSPDPQEKLREFAAAKQLTFPLLSDPDRTVLRAYGAFGEKKLYGKTMVGVIRSTFVIDPQGTIERAYYNVKATGHVARLRRELGV